MRQTAVSFVGHALGAALALLAAHGLSAQTQRPEAGFADDVLGRWDLTIEDPNGAYPSWLEIRLRTETGLMGRFVGRVGSVRHVADIDYADGRLQFSVPVQYEAQTAPLRFEGLYAHGLVVGSTRDSSGATLRFTARPAPTLGATAAPTWGEPIALFNGRDLSGWRTRGGEQAACWGVARGVLASVPPCVDLITERRFRDFALQLEFRYPPGSNSGVYLRGRYEVQIQDDRGKALDPLRLGGIYGFIAPRLDAAGHAGEWQRLDVELVGRRVTVALNGRKIIDGQDIPGITGGALDSREAEPGPIMLQGDHGPIEFRRVALRPAIDEADRRQP